MVRIRYGMESNFSQYSGRRGMLTQILVAVALDLSGCPLVGTTPFLDHRCPQMFYNVHVRWTSWSKQHLDFTPEVKFCYTRTFCVYLISSKEAKPNFIRTINFYSSNYLKGMLFSSELELSGEPTKKKKLLFPWEKNILNKQYVSWGLKHSLFQTFSVKRKENDFA